jgi:hypothetical protein
MEMFNMYENNVNENSENANEIECCNCKERDCEKRECEKRDYKSKAIYDGFYELTENDFFPPADDRVYTSLVCDVVGGDTFAEYAEHFWDTYGCEIYDDFLEY